LLVPSSWLVIGVLAISSVSLAQVSIGVSVRIGPPPLPVYEQPVCPGDGLLWIPGYWAWGPDGYFWVPGTWVIAPRPGLLWTPGYWGWSDGLYVWHSGYWGPHVGFYGGINYGFGYTGVGFAGGYWRGGAFVYNRAVTNVNVTVVHNTYNQTVINNHVTVNRVSYNGGAGGVTARPTLAEESAAHEQHVAPTREQTQQEHASGANHALLASANHGQPAIAATPKAGVFSGRDVVAARGAAPHVRGEERTTRPTPNLRGEARPALRAENPAGNARPNAERPAERPQPERPRARPSLVPEQPRGNRQPAERPEARPRPQNKPEPGERGNEGKSGERR
jgi:hypothetical protein